CILKMALRADAKKGDPPRDEVRRGNERASSPRTQIAKQKRTAGGAPAQSTFSKDACLRNLSSGTDAASSEKVDWAGAWGTSTPYGLPTRTRFGKAR
ncbi:MAG: hypothetical protein ACM3JI_02590, partial [Anaerolineae bacterium]